MKIINFICIYMKQTKQDHKMLKTLINKTMGMMLMPGFIDLRTIFGR